MACIAIADHTPLWPNPPPDPPNSPPFHLPTTLNYLLFQPALAGPNMPVMWPLGCGAHPCAGPASFRQAMCLTACSPHAWASLSDAMAFRPMHNITIYSVRSGAGGDLATIAPGDTNPPDASGPPDTIFTAHGSQIPSCRHPVSSPLVRRGEGWVRLSIRDVCSACPFRYQER